MRIRIRSVKVAFAFGMVGSGIAPLLASAQYMISPIDGIVVAGMNNNGDVVGHIWVGNDRHAALWRDGELTDLGTLGGDESQAVAVNDAGEVVGWSDNSAVDPESGVQLNRPFIWLPHAAYGLDAGMNDLGTLGGQGHAYARDINNRGQVVGSAPTAGSDHGHAFLWEDGAMVELATLGGDLSEAHAINEAGQIVGFSYTAEIDRHAALWQDGTITDLGTLDGTGLGGPLGDALGISESGMVVGRSYAAVATGDTRPHAFVWQDGAMTDVGIHAGPYRTTQAVDVHDAGLIVGQSDGDGAVVWANGRMIRLDRLVSESGWSFQYVFDVNKYQEILAQGRDADGESHAVILTPDCNANGIADAIDLLSQGIGDCNENGVPDECDADCNGNGWPDDCDIASGASPDVNGNGIPDECHEFEDCNDNGVFDYIDLADGSSDDFNRNLTPDECEPHGTIHVNAVAADSDADGSAAAPFGTIQRAIDDALSGEVILLAEGTYTGPGNRDLDFGGRALTLRSEDPDDPEVVSATVIDAEQANRAFYFHSGESSETVLDGLTIRNGADHFAAFGNSRGGNVLCQGASPVIRNCVITGGHAALGAGVHLEDSAAAIIDSTISGNVSEQGYIRGGGGVAADEGSYLNLIHSNLLGNTTQGFGGGLYVGRTSGATVETTVISNNAANTGGGVYVLSDQGVSLTGCTVSGNSSDASGGGVMVTGSGETRLAGCLIEANEAVYAGGGLVVDSLYSTADVHVLNTLIVGNDANEGGGIHVDVNHGSIEIVNSAIVGNSVSLQGGGIMTEAAPEVEQTIVNSIVWGNTGDEQIVLYSAVLHMAYSDVQFGLDGIFEWTGQLLWGDGMTDDDPMFIDAGGGDYRLSAGSPLIDAADNSAIPSFLAIDFDGHDRFVDVPDVADTGIGPAPVADIGPFELQNPPTPGDFDEDGDVDLVDFARFQLCFTGAGAGPLAESCRSGDFDVDDDIDLVDFASLQLAFTGPM